jgi:hypothetical protein
MDSFDEIVEKVLSKPYFKNNKWYVDVGFHSFGRYFETKLCFKYKNDAEKVVVGYEFIF